MDWVLRSPQIHSTFSNLGFAHADGYHVNENCNAVLETILHNILTEDKYLRTYRRSISFGQYIKKDLIPLLIYAKEDKTIELLIKILVNLTIPVECLLSVDVLSKTDFGSHTIFEINNLLAATKVAFTDHRATRVVVEFLKKNFETYQKVKLPIEVCTNVNNGLLLLRNILHIPDDYNVGSPNYSGPPHHVQNQILWNIFSQSIDKILIRLMNIPDASFLGVTMVQLIALIYKDQHVVTLHKLLNLWLETSLSESSEDNESNTSPPDRAGSEDSSPILTSEPTSDSSDTGATGKSNDEPNSINNEWNSPDEQMNNANYNDPPSQIEMESERPMEDMDKQDFKQELPNKIGETELSDIKTVETAQANHRNQSSLTYNKIISQENYGTQIENQLSISTSSNDDLPTKKPVHQKPQHPKQRANTKVRIAAITLQDRKRNKILKRGKSNVINNVQGLNHNTPTDDDISNILKEFTVDFLLKGYNSLVQTLHNQILTNLTLEIDTSHFFWLVTYFLKFAAQIELNLEHICSVLSYDIISYLTAEGVNLCEQFELAIKLDGKDLKPSIRRLHLVVTAIREFVQAIEVYKKISHICKEDQDALTKLQIKMCESEELRSLLVLLLRHYNPKYHSKQYLQDLIVTNHILLMFLDGVMKLPDYSGKTNMLDHIQQFASLEVMHQYGLLLEDFASNGEFVNDCVFTLMHHVGGELDCLISLFQPKILKTFTSIWQSEFEICDDWSDLIEYVINTFIKKPHTLQSKANFRLESENFEIDSKPDNKSVENEKDKPDNDILNNSSTDKWTENELSSLNWNYMQSKNMPDVIDVIIRLFKEDGTVKTRDSIIQELYTQNLIDKEEFESLSHIGGKQPNAVPVNKEIRDDEIGKLCEQLTQDGKSVFLDWVQKVLLEICCVKMYLDSKALSKMNTTMHCEVKLLNFECFKKKADELPVMSAVSYHSLLLSESVPLVPWNCEQAAICKDLKFLQLLHKIGLHMPVDTGKVFIRIPHFWSPDTLFEVAGKIAPIDIKNLKFQPVLLAASPRHASANSASRFEQDISRMGSTHNFYQIHKQKNLATFIPKPSPTYIPEEAASGTEQNWEEIIQKSQESKISSNIESASEKASVASDLTRMYVSDEDEKPEPSAGVRIAPRVDSRHSSREGPRIDPRAAPIAEPRTAARANLKSGKRSHVKFTLPL